MASVQDVEAVQVRAPRGVELGLVEWAREKVVDLPVHTVAAYAGTGWLQQVRSGMAFDDARCR
jgi:hypothetical protein